MNLDILIKPFAELDIEEASQWYEKKKTGLGSEFLDEIDACLTKIVDNPRIFVEKYRDIRRALPKRFPYAIYYIIEPYRIVVLAVIHTSMDPDYHKIRAR